MPGRGRFGVAASTLSGGGGEAGADPFGVAVLEAPGGQAPPAEFSDGVVGVDAVGPAAVRDDVLVRGEPVEFGVQHGDRDGAGAEDVPGAVLGGGAHVQNDDLPGTQPAGQLVSGDGFQPLAVAAGEGLGHYGEAVVERVFGRPVTHSPA